MYMNPNVLTVYKCPYFKSRLGKNNDGGYIIANIPDIKYNIMLSGGILDDISFETDFVNKYGVECVAFDGTIQRLPGNHNLIKFIKKNIGFYNTDNITNLHELIDNHDNIFVKMDIEGGEIPWIKSLSDEQMNKFSQIVMEFHKPFSNDEIDVFDKINKNHILVHFHGNNCSNTIIYKNLTMPSVFECTYLHKKFFVNPPKLNDTLIPSPLDMPNNLFAKEIFIDYPPFVHNVVRWRKNVRSLNVKIKMRLF